MTIQDPIIQAFFSSPQPVVLLRADAPNFTILGYNDAYREATYTNYRDITGWYLLEAFNPRFAGGDGAVILLEALNTAIHTKVKLRTAVFRYNIPIDSSGTLAERWWQLDIMPFAGESGAVTELLLTTNSVPRPVDLT